MKRTVLAMLEQAAEEFKDKPYVCCKGDSGWEAKSFIQVQKEARFFAKALIKRGFARNNTLSILSEGSHGWVTGEFGILYAGGISVPLSIKLLPEEIPFRVNHSESKGILVSKNTLEKVLSIREKYENPDLWIIYMDRDPQAVMPLLESYKITLGRNFLPFWDLVEEGRALGKELDDTLKKLEEETEEGDVVTISYTSGTTGNPKGIMLTHLNYYSNCRDSVTLFDVPRNFSTLIILPCDHSFAHTVGIYAGLLRGITLYFVDSRGGGIATLRNIPINLKEANPDFLLTVPALSGNFMKKIIHGVEEKGGLAKFLFTKGIAAGVRYNGNGFNKPSFVTRLFSFLPYKISDAVVFSKVRPTFGNKLKFCVGGGALLDIKQQEFFKALGTPIYQGYGLTEAAPVISSNTPQKHKLGSSGVVAPSVTCKIRKSTGEEAKTGETGEIIIQGENVMKGYFKNPEATAETIKDGWLYTGDLGYFDEDGFLVVVGREKALLISEDGEKYSPEEIEEAITNCSDLVHQVMIYCDHKKYTSSLLVLDAEKVKHLISQNNIQESAVLLEAIKNSMDQYKYEKVYKGRFPGNWTPVTFQILQEPFTEQNRMINSSMKMVRYKITETYKDLLEYMYTSEGRGYINPRNQETVKSLFGLEK